MTRLPKLNALFLAFTSMAALACGGGSSSSSGTSSAGGGTASTGSGSGSITVTCNKPSDKECLVLDFMGLGTLAAQQAQKNCSMTGGMLVSSCSSTGLIGCCSLPTPDVLTDTCYYGGMASNRETVCKSGGGTWSTTLP
jgi:hypothetical protein